jgi:hypothetical protein
LVDHPLLKLYRLMLSPVGKEMRLKRRLDPANTCRP